jgi:chemotaxis signal transduction protein
MNEASVTGNKAAELRQAFDLSFAVPPPQTSQEIENLLSIRVAGDPYAIRLCEIGGIVTGRKVIAIPAAALDFLGLVGIRGGIVPVFGLASILGYSEPPESLRWMIRCGIDDPVALAFSDFDGYLRLPKSCLYTHEDIYAPRQHVNQVARTETGIRAVISIPLILATIRNRIGHPRPTKEQ